MLLIAPSEASLAIGAKCGGTALTDEDAQLIYILDLLTPRMEDALNVNSLTMAEHIDRFEFPRYQAPTFPQLNPQDPKLTLRLSNGFIVRDTLLIRDADGVEVDTTDLIDIDFNYGIVNLTDWDKGVYTVDYLSGFEPITPDPLPTGYDPCKRVLDGIPSWMRSIVIDFLVQWYRTEFLTPRVVKDVSYGQMSEALQRMIRTKVYSRYQRPRQDCVWGESRDAA